MGARTERLGRALHVGRVARRGGLMLWKIIRTPGEL
jgi:hypothetical protein